MSTATTENTYTGVEGVLTVGGNPFAYVKADISIDRDTISLPRGGKWSDLALPGKAKPKIKISYGLVDSDLLLNAFDNGTNTASTSDETLHASMAGNGAIQPISSGMTPPSVPLTIKLKIISTDGFEAGAVIIEGTDANNVAIAEAIPFPLVATGATTTYYYGHTRFKTITQITLPVVLNINDGVTPYGMGQKTVTLGRPLYFTFVAKLYKSATQFTQITATNCWLKNYTLPLGGPSDPAIIDQDLEIRDPDTDITLTSTA